MPSITPDLYVDAVDGWVYSVSLFCCMPDLNVDAAGYWVVVAGDGVDNCQVPRLAMVQSGIGWQNNRYNHVY